MKTQTKKVVSADSKTRARVSRVLPFSCVDGPGNRMVIFLQGCNFSCTSCHNPHTINHCNHCGICVQNCPEGALSLNASNEVEWNESLCSHCDSCTEICSYQSSPKGWDHSISDLMEIIRSNHMFLSGITVSGGESTLQLPFITDLFKTVKSDDELSHLTCFIDSNGSLSVSGWQKVLPYLDGAMIDIKAWQTETHAWITGRDNHRVYKSIEFLAERGKLHEVRLLHIPEKSDLLTEVESVGCYLAKLPKDVQIRINAFQHHGVSGEALLWDKCSENDVLIFQDRLEKIMKRPVTTPAIYT